MGFDLLTGIWAANKAAEIVADSSSGSGVGLPVVDVSYETLSASAGSGTDVEVTATEAEMLSTAWATNLPIVVRVMGDGFYVSKPAYAMQLAKARKYYFAGEVNSILGSFTVTLYQESDAEPWMIQVTDTSATA